MVTSDTSRTWLLAVDHSKNSHWYEIKPSSEVDDENKMAKWNEMNEIKH